MSTTVSIGAVFALAGALVALVWLPARPSDEVAEPAVVEPEILELAS